MKKQLLLVMLFATGMIMDAQAGSWFGGGSWFGRKTELTLSVIQNKADEVKEKMIQVFNDAKDSKVVQVASHHVHRFARKAKNLADRGINAARLATTNASQVATKETKAGFESVVRDVQTFRDSKHVEKMNEEGHKLARDVHKELDKVEDLAVSGANKLDV